MPPLDHRPRSVSELIDTGIALVRRDFVRFCLVTAVGVVPYQVAQLVVIRTTRFDMSGQTTPELGALGLLLLVAILGFTFMESCLAAAVAQAYEGREVDVGASLRAGLARWMPVLGSSLLKYLLIVVLAMIGITVAMMAAVGVAIATTEGDLQPNDPIFVAMAVVAMIVGVCLALPPIGRYAAVPMTAALEPRGPVGAMRRSRELTRGLWKHAVGVSALALLIVLVPNLGASLLASVLGSQIVQQAIGVVTTVVLMPVYVASLGALYYDLRIRKEGFDLELMADRLAPTAPDLGPGAGPDLPATRGA